MNDVDKHCIWTSDTPFTEIVSITKKYCQFVYFTADTISHTFLVDRKIINLYFLGDIKVLLFLCRHLGTLYWLYVLSWR